MAKIPKVTFKNDPPLTGLAAVGHSIGCDVKVNGKVIGCITGYSWNNTNNKIRFMVNEDDGWKWVTLKYDGSNLNQSKQWLKDNWEAIYNTYGEKFHFSED